MRRRTVIGTAIAAFGTAIAATPGGALADVGARRTRQLLRAVASMREERGLAPLVRDPALDGIARLQALHIARTGRTAHLDAAGRDPCARACTAGYRGVVLGEALAETFDDPRETVALWLAHAGTRAVLLDPAAQSVGACGIAERCGLVWWDLMLGRPSQGSAPTT